MITYDSICKKLGFDPMTSEEYNNEQFLIEDDNDYTNPLDILSREELDFLVEYAKANN